MVLRFFANPCPTEAQGIVVPVIAPNTFDFSHDGGSNEGTFILRPTHDGCYEITAQEYRTSDTYESTSKRVSVVKAGTVPGSATISSAKYANDGLSFVVSWNTTTDRANTTQPIQCDMLFNFEGANTSRCIWITDYKVKVVLDGVIGPNVGDLIRNLPNKVRNRCVSGMSRYDCKQRAPAPATSVSLLGPVAPTSPKVTIVSSSRLAGCNDMILDPTNTYGNAGRLWKHVQWTVTACCKYDNRGHEQDVNVEGINRHLNNMYQHTNSKASVPNHLLAPGALYSVVLRVENAFGGDSQVEIEIKVVRDFGTPVVTIYPGAETSIYRWQELSLFVSAERPQCASQHGEYDIALEYQWLIYNGTSFLSGLVSTSNNPRFFILPPFSLEIAQRYKVLVKVSLEGTAGKTYTLAVVTVNILGSTPFAVIEGGNSRVISRLQPFTLDASDSADVDSPSSPLHFRWICFETSPNYGSPCMGGVIPDQGVSTPLISVPANTMGFKNYSFTVYVTNSRGNSAKAHQEIYVKSTNVPLIRIAPLQVKKFNPTVRLTLNASVELTGSAWLQWSCDKLSNEQLANFSTSGVLTTIRSVGISLIQLSILASSLPAGDIFTFRLSATYFFEIKGSVMTSNSVQSVSEIMISLNEPPRGGELYITANDPGCTHSSCIFTFQTLRWAVQIEAMPFQISLGYFRTYIRDTITVSRWSLKYEVQVLLGEGLESRNFFVSGVALARDVYGCIGEVVRKIRVTPSSDGIAFQERVISLIGLSNKTQNSELFDQVVAATVSDINKRGVTCGQYTDLYCASFGREPCTSISGTCGKCLVGFLGLGGQGNLPRCIRANTSTQIDRTTVTSLSQAELITDKSYSSKPATHVAKNSNYAFAQARSRLLQTSIRNPGDPLISEGQSCGIHADCETGYCKQGRCKRTVKTCPLDCSQAGICIIYGENNEPQNSNTALCMTDDAFCYVKCKCYPGRSGQSCELLDSERIANRATRQILCEGLVTSLSTQNTDATVVKTRGLQILELLVDPDQITSEAFKACEKVITETSLRNPEFVAGEDTIKTYANIFSQLVEFTAFINSGTLARIESSLNAIMLARQRLVSLDETTDTIENNFRFFSAKYTFATLSSRSLDLFPSSFNEKIQGEVRTRLNVVGMIPSPQSEIIGVSAFQFHRRMMSAVSVNSTMLNVQIFRYGSIPDTLTMTLTLQNTVNQSYWKKRPLVGSEICEIGTGKYNITPICPDDYTTAMTCPGNQRGFYNYSCPGETKEPMCTSWDGLNYVPETRCHVLTFSGYNTTCVCDLASSFNTTTNLTGNRIRSGIIKDKPNLVVMQIASSFHVIHENFNAEGYFVPNVQYDTIMRTLSIYMAGLLAIFFFMFTLLAWMGRFYDVYKEMSVEKKGGKTRSARDFFKVVLPIEFSRLKWYSIWFVKLAREHTLLCVIFDLNIHNERSLLLWAKYTILIGRWINCLFISAFVSYLF
jgi:hypothetical protein